MRSLRYWMKDTVYALSSAAGHFGASTSAILMYHEVGGPGGPDPKLFDRQIRWLADRFQLIRLRDLPETLEPTEPSVVVTFDDGYRSTVDLVLPVLARHGVNATFFISSGLLGASFRTSHGERTIVDADGVRAIIESGHEVGGHTLTHPRLTDIDPVLMVEEITGDRDDLGALLGTAPTSFAYPKGAHDHRVRAAVRNAGYRLAVTVHEGLLSPSMDPWALPRVQANATMGMVQFRAKLSGGLPIYERLRGRGE